MVSLRWGMSCISPKVAGVAADFRMLGAGLCLTIADTDPDYLLIEVTVSNGRFAGSTKVYGGLDDFDELARIIDGFPAFPGDHRSYEFGRPGASVAGGYVRLHFRTIDSAGHSVAEITIEDEFVFAWTDCAKLSFDLEALGIDSFVKELRLLQRRRVGEARLEPTSPST